MRLVKGLRGGWRRKFRLDNQKQKKGTHQRHLYYSNADPFQIRFILKKRILSGEQEMWEREWP